ncbi:MAG: NusA-like transcription termination signal-binding factor, partial [Methanomassiliicoccales archaeon]|nr:NusA-like transcription termination signal-binding factor [Methanomassiliicoccales archaeon]
MTTEITFTEETLRYIALFEKVTKARVRDCMETEDKLVYVVDPGQANRAVGKGGENVIMLKNTTGKNIQVVEFSDDPETFIKNVFYNYGPEKVEIETRG